MDNESLAAQVRKVCDAYRVPPWLVGVAPRPAWPTRLRYWLRGYRPRRIVPIMPPRHLHRP